MTSLPFLQRSSPRSIVLIRYSFHGLTLIAALAMGTVVQAAPSATRAQKSAAASKWQWLVPSPQGNRVKDIAFANGQYIAVGDAGTLLVSANGTRWQRVVVPSQESLRALAQGGGVVVAVGTRGAVLRSADGVHWQSVSVTTTETLERVVFGPGGFAAASGKKIFVSADGATWREANHGIPVDNPFQTIQGLAAGNGRYVAMLDVGPFSDVAGRVLSSTDGDNWSHSDFQIPRGWGKDFVTFRGVVFGEGVFVSAVARAESAPMTFRSADGFSWEAFAMPYLRASNGSPSYLYMKSFAYDSARSRFVGLASYNAQPPEGEQLPFVVESLDGRAWGVVGNSYLIDAPPMQILRSANGHLFGTTPYGDIYNSVDSVRWQSTTAPSPFWSIKDVVSNASGMLAVGTGSTPSPLPPSKMTEGVVMQRSMSGNWQVVPMPAAPDYTFREPIAVAHSSTSFVIAAKETVRSNARSQQAFYVSPRGAAWRRVDPMRLGAETLLSVGFGGGAFIAFAQDKNFKTFAIRSTDEGVTWRRETSSGQTPKMITHGGAGFVAIDFDRSGDVLKSADGLNWVKQQIWTRPGEGFHLIARSKDLILLVGQTWGPTGPVNQLVRSADGGGTWAPVSLDSSIASVSGDARGFVLTADNGDVLTSADGVNWTGTWSGANRASKALRDAKGSVWLSTALGGLLQQSSNALADLQTAVQAFASASPSASTVVYQVRITNYGPGSAPFVGLGVSVNTAVDDLSVKAPASWKCSSAVRARARTGISCNTVSLSPNAPVTFLVSFKTPSSLSGKEIAFAAAAASAAEEPHSSNNTATARLWVKPARSGEVAPRR